MLSNLHQTVQPRYRWTAHLSAAVWRISNYRPLSGSAPDRTSPEYTGNLAPDPTSPAPRPRHRWLTERK